MICHRSLSRPPLKLVRLATLAISTYHKAMTTAAVVMTSTNTDDQRFAATAANTIASATILARPYKGIEHRKAAASSSKEGFLPRTAREITYPHAVANRIAE